MVTIEGAYEGALRAFQSPMLALLHRRHAPLVVAALSTVLGPERQTVAVADAHTEVADLLDQLRAAGYDDLPTGNARDLCRSWVDAGWLIRQVDETDGEVYRLSAHAVGALEVAGRAGGPRARVTQSRVRTLLDAVDRLAQDADPDVLVRMARLDREIKRLTAELEQLDKTGVIEAVDDETLLEEAENVLYLVRELPADFARVAESIRALQREIVTALRQDDRPTGEVLREYLDRAQHLMDYTAEGRAFSGALRLIAEPERLDELAQQLAVVLDHPFARRMDAHQRAELRGITRRIEQGLDDVLTAQRRASHVIAAQVRHHDPLRDRQVDDLLRDVVAGLAAWIPGTRRGQSVDPLPRLPVAARGNLRFTLADLRGPQPPAPLAEWDDDVEATLDDALAWGGPHYGPLGVLLAERLADADGDPVAVADVFDAAELSDRRPVDLLGLLELAHRVGLDRDGDAVATVEAVRPDGTRRRLAFEALTVRPAEPSTPSPAEPSTEPSTGPSTEPSDEPGSPATEPAESIPVTSEAR